MAADDRDGRARGEDARARRSGPRRCRAASAKPTCGAEPRSRTVVKPARSVVRAFLTPITRPHIRRCRPPRRQKSPPGLPERWTWMSIRPGSTVRVGRSISRAPAGGGVRPAVTLWMRPSTMVMVEGPCAGRDAIGDQPAGMDDDGLGRSRARRRAAEEQGEQAGEHRRIPWSSGGASCDSGAGPDKRKARSGLRRSGLPFPSRGKSATYQKKS